MEYRETPLHFECAGAALVGVVARPVVAPRVGIVIVVGGPQYRVGSHRQFVALARSLAAEGLACLRFDYRGMGDSEGDPVAFDATGPDIAAAIEALDRFVPRLATIVLWGLCDGASASAFAGTHPRVGGLALFNPWVRTDASSAEATIRHYYARRFFERSFWSKLGSGNVRFGASVRALAETVLRGARGRRMSRARDSSTLPVRVGEALARHRGPALVALSGNDQTAAEFKLAARREGPLRDAITQARVTCVDIVDADHTFSSDRWRDEASAITLRWIRASFPDALPRAH